MKRIVLFLIPLCVFLGAAFFGGRYYMKYKTSREIKRIKREIEEDSELFATGIGILIILGIYFIGMLLPYFIH